MIPDLLATDTIRLAKVDQRQSSCDLVAAYRGTYRLTAQLVVMKIQLGQCCEASQLRRDGACRKEETM